MLKFVARLLSQARRFPSLGKAVVKLALLCPLMGILCVPSTAQYTTGLPTVGNAGAAKDSQMLIDATQFLVAPVIDMCGAIAAACAQVGTANYPKGATIDARGFTGVQVCSASNATTMLFQCTPDGSAHNATGGKLLLGSVNLYIDGPPNLSLSYTDGFGSGIGTPAVLIPNGFWGIEGISRGGGDQGSKLGQITLGPPTTLTILGTNTHTYDYICIRRN